MDLVRAVKRAGKPVIVVILAGRPLTIEPILADADAVLYAWHPGVMAGPAIADILFGVESPSGKLPVTFPRMVGQIPIYHAHRTTGKPPSPSTFVHIDDIPVRTPQTGMKNTSQYLDAGYAPLYPFGFGLSYARFEYSGIQVTPRARARRRAGDGTRRGQQRRARSPPMRWCSCTCRTSSAASRGAVRELKGFQRVRLEPGERRARRFRVARPTTWRSTASGCVRATEPGSIPCLGGWQLGRPGLGTEFELTVN